MPSFDESTLRKAASWQDFKEAQLLLKNGSILESEETQDGWRGSSRSGQRTYRTTVVARTPTWFDAKCSCAANQRDGSFCPHAIALGLHLSSPPKAPPKAPPQPTPPNTPLPFSWKIRFQGPWQNSLSKGQLSVAISHDDSHPPTLADATLTTWLISQKINTPPPLHLSLTSSTLPTFLTTIQDHPSIIHQDTPITVESTYLLPLSDCSEKNSQILLTPTSSQPLIIGNTLLHITPASISISSPIPTPLQKTFQTLASGTITTLPLETFLHHLPFLQSVLDLSKSHWFSSLKFIPATPQFLLTLLGSPTRITPSFTHSYSEQTLPLLRGNTLLTRNTTAESAALSLFHKIIGTSEITDPPAIQHLLTVTLKSLPIPWEISLAPPISQLAASYIFVSPSIQIHPSTDHSITFDLSFIASDGTVIPSSEIRKILASKSSPFPPSKGPQHILSSEIEAILHPLLADLELSQQNGHYTSSGPSAEIIREISNSFQKSTSPPPPEIPQPLSIPTLTATLRPYQVFGTQWLIDRLNRYSGALLADDMGLGKTLQTIALIEHTLTTTTLPAPALIVVTTSLLGNWRAEFSRFAPQRNIITLHGSNRDSLRPKIKSGDVILTTYSTLARDLAYHLSQAYSLVVIDEASLIRNPDSDHSKAVARLNATSRIALTGTPVENSARDLWAIFRFIQPGWLGTRKQFDEKYQQPLKSPDTAPQASHLLRLKTSPFVLRRTKQQVAPELPSKIHIDEFCTLSKEQLATYRDLQKEGQRKIDAIETSGQSSAARMATLTTLLRLRQACCDLALFDSEKLKSLPIPRRSAKLERLLEITEQSIASGSKLLIFSQFQKQLIEIETQLTASAIPSLRLDGTTRNRQAIVDTFQSPAGPPVFLISLKAGGYGLNLTAADVVIHFDPWWNPAAEAQATDRAHRIGQTKPVTVFRLLTRNTVEEKVTQLQSTKKALADSLDESITPTDAPAWSTADLTNLLRP